MSKSKRDVEYQIKIDGCEPIKGTIRVNINESLTSIRQRIQEEAGYGEGTICIEEPTGSMLPEFIKLIVLREVKLKSPQRKYSEGSIVLQEQSIIERTTSQKFMYQEPEMPARVVGTVQRCYPIFSCMSSTRQMTLNFLAVTFSYPRDQAGDPQRSINLKQIREVSTYRKKNLYFLRLTTSAGQRVDLKFQNKDLCRQWLNHFNKALDYLSFLSEKKDYSRAQSYSNFIHTLEQRDKSKVVKLQASTFAQQGSSTKENCKDANTIIPTGTRVIRLADFKIKAQIGKGAFSTVYKAERSGKIYALKQISKDKLIYENQLKYAISQLNILKKCNNKCPFIIPFSYAFQTENYLYIGMMYLPFGTLKEVLQKRKQLTVKQALGIITQLIMAIEFLHKKNILYRDMKPQNILLTQEGHIYLIDFGLSIQLDDQEEFAQSFVGTPLYLAPQRLQGSGKVNYKADIYGVGCIFYLLIHGHAPFQADTLASIIFSIKNNQLKIQPDLDDLVQDFLKNTLETKVEKRLNCMSSHPLFENVNWKKVAKKDTQIMNIQMKGPTQMSYCNGVADSDYTEQNYPNKKINQWNYVDIQASI